MICQGTGIDTTLKPIRPGGASKLNHNPVHTKNQKHKGTAQLRIWNESKVVFEATSSEY